MADQIANLELGLSVRTKINAALTAIDGKAPLSHTHVAANITDFTEAAQDAIGAALDVTLVHEDITNILRRAAITGDVTIDAGSNTATLATVPVLKGGTGATDAATARTNLGLGTMATQAASAVAITGGSIAGITDLAVTDGGTGASDAATARTNLGLGTIATQASSAVSITGGSITGITDLAIADGGTGAGDAATARTNLGLGTMATQAASTVAITGGTINGTTVGATTAAAVTGAPIASTSVVTSGFTTLAAGTLALAFASKGVVQVTPNATGSFTSTVPPAGTRCTLIVLTSGVTSFTMTFGTGFKTAGTLATGTVTAKTFVFQFVSDGTNLIECSRTTAL
jgi:hypothetical protein